MRKIVFNIIFIAAIAFFLLPFPDAGAYGGTSEASKSYSENSVDDISALTSIANLRAEDYINARDKFIQSMSGPIDINDALDKGWEEGLLVLIINSRLDESDLFDVWDKTGFDVGIMGVPFWYPNPYPHGKKQIQYCELFRTEVFWKYDTIEPNINNMLDKNTLKNINEMKLRGIWPKYILDEQIQGIAKGGSELPGDPKVWQKIASQSDDQNIMMVACHSLTQNVDETSRNLIESKLKSESVNGQVKMAIIAGLFSNKPDYAASVLLNTYNDWQKDIEAGFEYEAFKIFARQPSDSNSSQFLKNLISDENKSEGIRKSAISSLIVNSEPNNYIMILRDVLINSSSIILRRAAAAQFLDFPRNLTRSIFQDILETETNPYIIEQSFRVVGLPQNSDAILSRMEQLLKQEDLPEDTIRSAKAVIARIKEMKK